ncbi:MAG: hypothetical protein K6F53_09020 [Lachnospiraceae bacterium]|nr:hypothetical protein [Lachnospiraceae bacterium]
MDKQRVKNMKKLIVYLLTAAMLCGIIFTANGSPVYAAGAGISPDFEAGAETAPDEGEIFAENESFSEEGSYDGPESGVEAAGEIPEEEITTDEDFRAEELGDGELPLLGEVMASDLTENGTYLLTGNAVITLADGDDVKINSIKKADDDADFSLTIKAEGGSAGTGELFVKDLRLENKNSLIIESGNVEFGEVAFNVGSFSLTGGSVKSPKIYAQRITISGGSLDIYGGTEGNAFFSEHDTLISGGDIRIVSVKYNAMYVYGDCTITGGNITSVAYGQGNSEGDAFGIRCKKDITISGDAVIYAQGLEAAIASDSNPYKIVLASTHQVLYPAGGKTARAVTDSEGNVAHEAKIAPLDWSAGIESSVYNLDFGYLQAGYDQAAADEKEMSLVLTNKSTQTVDYILPESEKYSITAENPITGIAPDGRVTLKVKPKTGIEANKGGEIIAITSSEGDVAYITMALKVGYYLFGEVAASSLRNISYELVADTSITLSATDNSTVYKIDCASYDLVIKGSDSGQLNIRSSIKMNSGEATLTVEGGTVSAGSISGKGNVNITGGSVTCTACIQMSQGNYTQSGGSLKITEGHGNSFALSVKGDITITGGSVDVNNTKGGSAMEATAATAGNISISNADVKAVTVGDYGIASSNGSVNIGAGSKVYARGTTEAIFVKGGSGKNISVGSSLIWTVPAGGRVGTSEDGENSGHILDPEGNRVALVKIVDVEPVVTIEAEPATLSFGRVPYGYKEAPAAQEFVINNTGESPVSLKLPTAEKYVVSTEDDLDGIPAGGSVTFSVRPKIGIERGAGNETLEISASDDSQSIEVEFQLSVEYLLTGEMEAGDLVENVEYKLIGDTTLHIAAGVKNKKITKITYDDTTNAASLTITGDDTGKLSVGSGMSNFLRGDVTILGGTFDAGSLLSTYGKIDISGGKIISKSITTLGDINISGGTVALDTSSGEESLKAKNITISGGIINADSTVAYPVICAGEAVKITGGKITLKSNKNHDISAKSIVIGGNALIDATTSAEGFEAVTLNDYSKGKITIADTVNLVNPAGGYVAESGANAGHIVDADGNTVKTVRFYPVVLEADPDPVDFGSAVLGYIPDEQTVTIKNTDSREVTLSPVASDYYTIGDYSVSTLASGESATFTIQPKEGAFTVAGPHEEILKIMTNEADIFKKLPVRFTTLDPGDKIWIANIAPQTYTGSEIKPAPVVYYQGHRLAASDYTVKYSGNKNVKRNKKGEVIEGAKVTVTGKGNFAGKTSKSFMILPKSIGDGTKTPAEQITAGTVHILKNSKAFPVLTYGTYQLNSKDFKVENANKKYKENAEVTVTGKGNFTGSVKVDVIVANKKDDLKTLNVVVDGGTNITFDPSKDEEAVKALIEGKIKVYDKADKTKTTPLTSGTHYEIISPSNLSSAGTKTIRIIALGNYSGSQTKKITVKPLAVKASAGNGRIETNAATPGGVKEGTYTYKPSGVTIGSKLEVKYVIPGADPGDDPIFEKTLTEGKDYKLSYSNNKAASTATKKASYTITFTGNYKGTPQLKNTKKSKKNPAIDDYSFTISRAAIGTAGEKPASGVEAVIPDVVYSGKADLYTSAPYVLIDGVQLPSKNYSVTCYKTSGRADTDKIGKKNKLSIAAEDPSATVYVKITGKGNYEGTITKAADDSELAYRVLKKADNTFYDLSKARVTIYAKGYDPAKKNNKILKSVSYNGKARRIDDYDIDGTVVVEYKFSGKKYTGLVEGKDYELEYLNNREKGKAVLIVKGLTGNEYEPGKTRSFLGVKRAGFSIGTKSIKDLLINPFAE